MTTATMEAHEQKCADSLAAALILDRACTSWQAELTFDDAIEFMNEADMYNRMEQAKMLNLLANIDAAFPKAQYPDVNGKPNPNNGNRVFKLSVGNEGSRVLYVSVYRGPSSMALGLSWDSIKNSFALFGDLALADEANVSEDSEHFFRFRFWWD